MNVKNIIKKMTMSMKTNVHRPSVPGDRDDCMTVIGLGAAKAADPWLTDTARRRLEGALRFRRMRVQFNSRGTGLAWQLVCVPSLLSACNSRSEFGMRTTIW